MMRPQVRSQVRSPECGLLPTDDERTQATFADDPVEAALADAKDLLGLSFGIRPLAQVEPRLECAEIRIVSVKIRKVVRHARSAPRTTP